MKKREVVKQPLFFVLVCSLSDWFGNDLLTPCCYSVIKMCLLHCLKRGFNGITTVRNDNGIQVTLNDTVKLGTVGTDGSANVVLNGTAGTGNVGAVKFNDVAAGTVSGLSNITWDSSATLTDVQKGVAATQGQLQQAISSYKTSDTDYRLVANSAAENGHYAVADNNSVTMQVVDANKASNTYDVVIDDVAKASALKTVADNYVKKIEKTDANNLSITQVVGGVPQTETFTNTNDQIVNKTYTATNGSVALNKVAADGTVTENAVVIDGIVTTDKVRDTLLSYKANNANGQTTSLENGLNFTNGTNTTASVAANGEVKVSVNDTINLTEKGSLNVGATTVNDAGLTITGGPSVTTTGISAGSKQITNVADKDYRLQKAENGYNIATDAAGNNTVTLHVEDAKGVDTAGYDVVINDVAKASDLTNKTIKYKANGVEDGAKEVVLTNGLDFVNGKNTSTEIGDAGVVKVNLNDNITLGSGDKQVNINGVDGNLSVGNTASKVILDGVTGQINAGSEVVLNGVAGTGRVGAVKFNDSSAGAGTVSGLTNTNWLTDGHAVKNDRAATEGQLKKVQDSINTYLGNKTFGIATQTGSVSKTLDNTIMVKGSDGNLSTKVTSTANGDTTENVVEIVLNQDLNLNSVVTGNTTMDTNGLTVGDAATGTTTTITNSKVQTGDSTLNADGSATIGKVEIDKAGNISNDNIKLNNDGTASFGDVNVNKDGTISGLTNNTWESGKNYTGSSNAATEGQIADAINGATGEIVNKGLDFVGDDNETIHKALGDKLAIKGDENNISVTNMEGALVVSMAKYIKVESVEAGSVSADKVTVGGVEINAKDDSLTIGKTEINKDGTISGLTNTSWDKDKDYTGSNKAATESQLQQIARAVAVQEITFADDKGSTVTKKLDETIKLTGDNNLTTVKTNDGIQVTMKKELTGLEKVEVGDTTINNKGLSIKDGPSMTQEGIDAGKKVITGVAAGKVEKGSTEAINGDQLNTVVNAVNNLGEGLNNVDSKVASLGSRINKVGAHAAALAALHPMDFDSEDKLSFAAGYGNYQGESAGAIGAFYRPDEKTMFSISGTVSNHENMFNAGVSFALDRTPHVGNRRAALEKQVIDLTAKVNMLTQANNGNAPAPIANSNVPVQTNNNMVAVLRDPDRNNGQSSAVSPNLPKEHWGYAYVKELAEQGYLVDYPYGDVKTKKVLSRYEFANALYRAVINGAFVDDKMGRGMDEFAKELDNVAKAEKMRIDRIPMLINGKK